MIGLVFVMHGILGETLKGELEHVVGPQGQATVFNVTPATLPGTCRCGLLEAIDSVDSGQGVILLTDMFGSTPSNVAISVLQNDRVEVLTGVNMPMLVKLAQMRGHASMQDCLNGAEEAGRRYISVASHLPPACLSVRGTVWARSMAWPVMVADRMAQDTSHEAQARIVNQRGLHARAAARFVTVAEKFDATVDVIHVDMTVSGHSIMGLMMLGAGRGETICIRTQGPQGPQALSALLRLVRAGFDEDD